MSSNDADLLRAVSQGSEDAFGTLVGHYHRQVRAACRRQAPSAEVDDCVQAVFLLLFQRAASAEKSPVLLAWLLRVAHFVCRDSVRHQRRKLRLEASASAPSAEGHQPDAIVLERLDAALLTLNERQRAAVSLHVLAGENPAAVAQHLGVSQDLAYKLIQRGLATLRTKLERHGTPISASILVGITATSLAGAESDPHQLITIIVHQPSAYAVGLAHHAWKHMTIARLSPWLVAASLITVIGIAGLVAVEHDQLLQPPPPIPDEQAHTSVEVWLAQRPGLALNAFSVRQAMETLDLASPPNGRLDFVCPEKSPPHSIEFLCGPHDTVKTVIEAIAQQAGCRWTIANELIQFTTNDEQLIPGEPKTWDTATLEQALNHGRIETVRLGILAWLEKPKSVYIPPIIGRHWLGQAVLAHDPELAARCAAAGMPGADSVTGRLPNPLLTDAALHLAQLRNMLTQTNSKQSVNEILNELVHLDTVQDPYFYVELIANQGNGSFNTVEDLRLLVASRCGWDGRHRLLTDGPNALRRSVSRVDAAQLLGRGFDPTWHAELVQLLQKPGDDLLRQAAEIVTSRSADPATWTAFIDTWRSNTGEDRNRLGGLMLIAGSRGIAIFREAIISGNISPKEAIESLQKIGVPTTALIEFFLQCAPDTRIDPQIRAAMLNHLMGPLAEQDQVIETVLHLAKDAAMNDDVRTAAINKLARSRLTDERIVALGRSLLVEGVATASARWKGLGLKILHMHANLHTNAAEVQQALIDPSPFLRATALSIYKDDLGLNQNTLSSVSTRIPAGKSGISMTESTAPAKEIASTVNFRALALDDPNSQVRLRAADIYVHLLPQAERLAALTSLIEHESDPTARATMSVTYEQRVSVNDEPALVHKKLQFLGTGVGFPGWIPSNDEPMPANADSPQNNN